MKNTTIKDCKIIDLPIMSSDRKGSITPIYNNVHILFDPEKSAKNVGIWKKMKDSDEIKLIEKELKDYLYIT